MEVSKQSQITSAFYIMTTHEEHIHNVSSQVHLTSLLLGADKEHG